MVRQPRSRATPIAEATSGSPPKPIAMSSGSASRWTCRRSDPLSAARPIAGSARLPTITGCTNSTAMWRTSERAAGVLPNATSRPPRAKRSASRWQSDASRSASVAKKAAFDSLRSAMAPSSRRLRASMPTAPVTRAPPRARPPPRASPATRRRPRPCARSRACAPRPGGRHRGCRAACRRRSRGGGAGRSC